MHSSFLVFTQPNRQILAPTIFPCKTIPADLYSMLLFTSEQTLWFVCKLLVQKWSEQDALPQVNVWVIFNLGVYRSMPLNHFCLLSIGPFFLEEDLS